MHYGKEEVYAFLKEKGIDFEATEHEPVFHMGELMETPLPYPEADAKNLFVRDKKREHYYLITVRGEKRVDLKAFRKEQGTRPLSFAEPEALQHYLGVEPGSVSPFGILNDEECAVSVFLDEDFWKEPGLFGIHPNDNTATVWIGADDLMQLLKAHGNRVERVKLPVKAE